MQPSIHRLRNTLFALGLLLSACEASQPRRSSPAPHPPEPPAPAPIASVPVREPAYYDQVCRPNPPYQAPDGEVWSPPNRISEPRTGDACDVADSNLLRTEHEILQARRTGKPVSPKPGAAQGVPLYLDKLTRHIHPNAAELSLFQKNGFVVLASRPLDSYATAYHDIFQHQLPVFVTADSLFHALFASSDSVMLNLEKDVLAPLLHDSIVRMHCTLPSVAGHYPADTATDLDLYLTVARGLLSSGPDTKGMVADLPQATALIDKAQQASGLEEVMLFGRPRMIDFTQYAPRGRYLEAQGFWTSPAWQAVGNLESYFRASMWLSRLELNLVSRSCRSSHPGAVPDPSETPREAILALAIADLAHRAGVVDDIARLDRAWTLLGGRREDVSIATLLELRRKAGIRDLRGPNAYHELRRAIGDDFPREARLHYMPQGSPVLPVIATLLGPRVVDDTVVTRHLVHDEVEGRGMVGAGDMAYVLGHDRAKPMLRDDIRRFPTLENKLAKARRRMAASGSQGDGTYAAWMGAVLGLSARTQGIIPSFMDTEAYQDMRMNSALVAFGQLRHNYVLIAGQGFDAYGCEIPDGYLEPAVHAYQGLIEFARRSRSAMAELDPADASHAGAYYARVEQVLSVLLVIANDELAGWPLTDAQKRYLAMVAEHIPSWNVDSGGPPQYTGWYFDLFPHRDRDSKARGSFVADYFTSTNLARVAYLGATPPRLGLFLVDTGGHPRVMAGPVARGYELTGPLTNRLSDQDAEKLSIPPQPWEQSYTAAAVPEPPLQVRIVDASATMHVLGLRSTRDLGPVTVEILDHHGEPIASRTVRVGAKEETVRFVLPGKRAGAKPAPTYFEGAGPVNMVEGVHIGVGEFHHVEGGSDYRLLQNFSLGEMRAPAQP